MPTPDKDLRKQLLALLKGGQAHIPFHDAVKAIPARLRGVTPKGLPYSAWQIVEHIRIAQRDILDFSQNRNLHGKSPYKPLKWPDDYWPKSPSPPNSKAWTESLRQVRRDRAAFEKLVRHEPLHTPFAWGEGQTLLREALLIADHTAYHVGELIVLRRLLGIWK